MKFNSNYIMCINLYFKKHILHVHSAIGSYRSLIFFFYIVEYPLKRVVYDLCTNWLYMIFLSSDRWRVANNATALLNPFAENRKKSQWIIRGAEDKRWTCEKTKCCRMHSTKKRMCVFFVYTETSFLRKCESMLRLALASASREKTSFG